MVHVKVIEAVSRETIGASCNTFDLIGEFDSTSAPSILEEGSQVYNVARETTAHLTQVLQNTVQTLRLDRTGRKK